MKLIPILFSICILACNSSNRYENTEKEDDIISRATGLEKRGTNNNIDTTGAKHFVVDHSDLSKTTALKFLLFLKDTSVAEHICEDAPDKWVKKEDLPYLIKCLDSNTVITSPVINKNTSTSLLGHGYTTLALEAYWMINAYRKNYYPTSISTKVGDKKGNITTLPDSLKNETLRWWKKATGK